MHCVDCIIGGGSGECTVWTASSMVGVVYVLYSCHPIVSARETRSTDVSGPSVLYCASMILSV